jgi:general secretion pathway protein G
MVIRQRDNLRQARRGFTLMEILVVVAIIVILAGLGGYYFIGALDGAKKDRAILGAKEIAKAVNVYYTEHQGQWPPNLQVLIQRDGSGKGPYLKGADYLMDPWGNPYLYDLNGPMNNTLEPDVWCQDPKTGQKFGNWTMNR